MENRSNSLDIDFENRANADASVPNKVYPDQRRDLEKLATIKGRKMSVLVREALDLYISNHSHLITKQTNDDHQTIQSQTEGEMETGEESEETAANRA